MNIARRVDRSELRNFRKCFEVGFLWAVGTWMLEIYWSLP